MTTRKKKKNVSLSNCKRTVGSFFKVDSYGICLEYLNILNSSQMAKAEIKLKRKKPLEDKEKKKAKETSKPRRQAKCLSWLFPIYNKNLSTTKFVTKNIFSQS